MFIKRIIGIVLFTTCFTLFLKAHVEQSYFLSGTFGERYVALHITNVDGYWNGRYFFLDSKKDVYLKAVHEANHIQMESTIWDPVTKKEMIVEVIEIREDSTYNWKGHWKSPNGTIQDVNLKPINPDSISGLYINHNIKQKYSPYSIVRFADIKFEKGKKEKIAKGIFVRWYTELNSGVSMFRMEKGLEDSVENKINQKLLELHLNDLERFYSCGQVGITGRYEQDIKIKFINKKIISFVKEYRSNCFELEMTSKQQYYNIEINNLQLLNLEDIFWMGEGSIPRVGSREYFQYRKNTFPDGVIKILKSEYPDRWINLDCPYENSKLWSFPDWYITNDGIQLIISHYLLSGDCDKPDWVLLPYNAINKYINKHYFE